MVKRCVAAGCSNTNSDGVSLFQFPRDPALRMQWTREVQRTRANWQGPSDYSVLCSDHFTNDCYEEDTTIAARFGIGKRRRLKPNAIPTVFHRQASTQVLQGSNDEYAEETQCTSRKRPTAAKECIQVEQKRTAFEKRERKRVSFIAAESGTDIHIRSYTHPILLLDCTRAIRNHTTCNFV